jgi:hypothetical protein
MCILHCVWLLCIWLPLTCTPPAMVRGPFPSSSIAATTPAPHATPATTPPAAAVWRRGTAREFRIELRLDAEMV